MSNLDRLLKEYLNIYWLRPESSLLRTIDALVLAGVKFKRPSLDLGCADGLNSYILQGGSFNYEVDAFLETLDLSAKNFFEGRIDIYNYSSHKFPEVKSPPCKFDVGLDWKQDLLNKAEKLNLYEQLIQHDANKPLPFADNQFNSVFSNIIYWIKQVDLALSELRRVITPNGKIHLLLTSDTLKQFLIYNYYKKYGWEWIKNLDMGRHAHACHYLDAKQWNKHFYKAGLKIEKHTKYLSARVFQISEIGLRPISPVLIKMANLLTGEKRKEVKEQMIKYLFYLSKPLFKSGWLIGKNGPQTFHYYVLSKR